MQYRKDKKSGNNLSILGFGCMRFPKKNINRTDMDKTEHLILNAVQNGINYFDTAFTYGGSEDILGQILKKNNLRDKIYLATKLPLVKFRKYRDFNSFLNTQLERLQTDYIDYYLLHNLSDMEIWKSLCDIGIERWIKEKKESGLIKNMGFSFHGKQNEFPKLLEAHEWDFCQIQYNYININYQAGLAGLKKAAEKGLSVFIMEPLLGGKLATGLPKKAVKAFNSVNKTLSPAAWSLRWLWNQREVTVVLSGMNSESQLAENIQTADNSAADMLNEEENAAFNYVIKTFNDSYRIPCTGCNYCMPCPHNVNIPGCFAAYNVSYTAGMYAGVQQYLTSAGITGSRINYAASNCKQCGECEKRCPQHIPIAKSMKKTAKRMESFLVRFALRLLDKFK
ncbi:MAG: aldo/keto reductase [Treponema sp.]|jgi:predicted aldo/keto reductase-like oxidoreductase|nr:aldo/keto reductase [Treponema sp.]